LKMELDESVAWVMSEAKRFRLFALARLNRPNEAVTAFSQWSASQPDAAYRDYVESLVPLWLGRRESAIARLEKGLADAESADPTSLFYLACACALFAGSDTFTEEEKRVWIDRAVTLLKRWSKDDEQHRFEMRINPDLVSLHHDSRFVKLAAERWNVPAQEYWLASREVTRGEYESFLNDMSYTDEKPKDEDEKGFDTTYATINHPANVGWYDAIMYCNWLCRREGRAPAYRYTGVKINRNGDREVKQDQWEKVEGANGYRLPSELEWEYACRAGSLTDWSTGNDDSLLELYCQMIPSKVPCEFDNKLPNAWGLADMHGNVWEWCWDLWDPEDSSRVIRGGSWYTSPAFCKSAYRLASSPTSGNGDYGFRLALSSSEITD
jgi:formylglycine-generating enzyme required for sulfatase activity